MPIFIYYKAKHRRSNLHNKIKVNCFFSRNNLNAYHLKNGTSRNWPNIHVYAMGIKCKHTNVPCGFLIVLQFSQGLRHCSKHFYQLFLYHYFRTMTQRGIVSSLHVCLYIYICSNIQLFMSSSLINYICFRRKRYS